MQSYDDLVVEAQARVREVTPWDFGRRYQAGDVPLLLDVREPAEFAALHIPGSINVPRGILEQSCEWDYDETVPPLAGGREREIVVICRSGKRSVLAADSMQRMGFAQVVSLKLGIRGWNDAELPLQDAGGKTVDADAGDEILASRVRPEQRKP
ncbi:MAG: rhodanese-like domain-containing protein [Gallionella sp.]|nr:rhodanese-like domain-containing protein [Gallionella sp.]NCP80431.1 rhodanese-like domain-containing protein [Gallionella sp.]NCS74852.1 rhodanese-like domain-containing protein [Gallionella sp.]PJC05040.1 MAG: sulfurtransferase [Gallionellaceae bacterium CG_4_9_14_0_8_um_filter_60_335]